MDTLIPARKRAASVALLFCGRDGKTDLSGVGSVGGAGVGNRELGLDKIGGVDRRSCDLKDTKPAAKIKSTASALREVFTKTRMDRADTGDANGCVSVAPGLSGLHGASCNARNRR